MWPFSKASPRLTLGTVKDSFPLWPALLTLDAAQVATHKHIIGTTGTGKSGLLKTLLDADGLIAVPANAEGLYKGALTAVWPL